VGIPVDLERWLLDVGECKIIAIFYPHCRAAGLSMSLIRGINSFLAEQKKQKG